MGAYTGLLILAHQVRLYPYYHQELIIGSRLRIQDVQYLSVRHAIWIDIDISASQQIIVYCYASHVHTSVEDSGCCYRCRQSLLSSVHSTCEGCHITQTGFLYHNRLPLKRDYQVFASVNTLPCTVLS
jgi:hypothetical protein